MRTEEFAVDMIGRSDEAGFESSPQTRREGKVLIAISEDLKRAALSRQLHRRGYGFTAVQGAQALVAQLRLGGVDLVICEAQDAIGPEMDIITLVRQTMPGVPVIVLGQGDVDADRSQVDIAMGLSRGFGRAPEGRNALSCLTTREREVLERIVAGRANKMIAYELSISPRTVENHRARVMEKLRAKTVADLVRIALTAGCGAPSSIAVNDSANVGGPRAVAVR